MLFSVCRFILVVVVGFAIFLFVSQFVSGKNERGIYSVAHGRSFFRWFQPTAIEMAIKNPTTYNHSIPFSQLHLSFPFDNFISFTHRHHHGTPPLSAKPKQRNVGSNNNNNQQLVIHKAKCSFIIVVVGRLVIRRSRSHPLSTCANSTHF